MKKMKKMKVFIVAVLLFLTVNVMGVSAAEHQGFIASETEAVIINDEELQLSKPNVGIVALGQLQVGYVSVNMMGNGKAGFGGQTCANRDVAYVAISVTLEKQVDGKWTQVDNVYLSFINTSIAYVDKTVSVTPGAKYRAHAWYIVIHEGVYEQAESYSTIYTAY